MQYRNLVMFVVEVRTVVTLIMSFFPGIFGGPVAAGVRAYDIVVTVVLFVALLFANFAEALAEGRGRAQAESLRHTRTEIVAHRIGEDGQPLGDVPASQLRKGDYVRVDAGELIPADGEIVRGVASIDESAITVESAPVIREAGGDFSSVTGGTRVLSDWRMIALVEGAEHQKSPNELALTVLLAALTLIFLIIIDTLPPMGGYLQAHLSVATLIALLVCLIPTTIGALLSAIGISGMDRVIRFNIIAKSGKAVEAAGDVDTLILDKTGTITLGNRMADAFQPMPGVDYGASVHAALLTSAHDETPEGKSIVVLAEREGQKATAGELTGSTAIAFSAETRRSGVVLGDGREISKGAVDVIGHMAERAASTVPPELDAVTEQIARAGGTPLGVIANGRVLGVVHLKDIIFRDIGHGGENLSGSY